MVGFSRCANGRQQRISGGRHWLGGKFSEFAPIRPLDSPGSVTGSDCDVEGSSQATPLSEFPLRFSTRHHHLHYPSAGLPLYTQGATRGPPFTGDRFQPTFVDSALSTVEIRSRTSLTRRPRSSHPPANPTSRARSGPQVAPTPLLPHYLRRHA